jgi:hypothetical protein
MPSLRATDRLRPGRDHSRHGERGQVLLLFAFLVTAMLFMAALLFDGANALVSRRTVQNAADAGAIEGANAVQAGSPRGCNGGSGSSPRATVEAAARAATMQNLGGYAVDSIVITCPSGGAYSDQAVQVTISATSPSFFSGIFSVTGSPASGISLGASGTAINGTRASGGSGLSVALLNPSTYNRTWSQNGCPSFELKGGPTVKFFGGLHVNSACPATGPSSAAIIASGGGSGSVTFESSNSLSVAKVVGGYAGAINWTPLPKTGADGVTPVADSLAGLPTLNVAGMTVQSTTKVTLDNGTPFKVFEPGVYKGGIELKVSSVGLMLPGIYVMQGGGLAVGAQASLYSVNPCPGGGIACYLPAVVTATTWATNCSATTCGVLIFNTGSTVGGSGMGAVNVGGQGNIRLRSYRGTSDDDPYSRLLIWQDARPIPASSTTQPTVTLTGGGNVTLTGTVYVPSALVLMKGGSGGAGGETVTVDTDLTLQFIAYDLQLNGKAQFQFRYVAGEFAKSRVAEYGLIADPSN